MIRGAKCEIVFCFLLFGISSALAQQPAPTATPATTPPAGTPPATPPAADLKGLGFGVGLGFRVNVLKPDLVQEATVDTNGIVRVNSRNNTHAGLVLEMHHFPWTFRSGNIGHGPFVAVQSGTDQVISAAAAGWMVGFRISGNKAFGLGVGYAGLPSAKVLGSEFVENQPAPKGPDGLPLAVRYQQRDKGSMMMVLSFVFN